MQEYISIFGNAVTGLFTLFGVCVTWWLSRKNDDKLQHAARATERHKELVDLYTKIFSSIEQAMKCVIEQERYEMSPEQSLLNGKIRLLGSAMTNRAFDDVAAKLESWSKLQIAASPKKIKVGEQPMVILQSPDPTEKYKSSALQAHNALQDSLKNLLASMQKDLKTH